MESDRPLADMYAAACPTRQILDVIGDKWTALVIGLLEAEPKRFVELQRCIGGISSKMLTQTLRNLERDGLVSRKVYPEIPPRVEYTLTPLGETLCAPLAAFRDWAEAHIGEVTAAQSHYDRREA
ncbi:MAG: helix-turn-helix transcriptional regulator [Anaerolineae bacterium]|nr:helix-turn-helix transcriptional regulator [Anaerolineae bacterium]